MQWLMLQQPEPEDFVIATGVQHSVRDFVTLAARRLDMELAWHGTGADETAIVTKAPEGSAARTGQCVVAVDPRYYRPAEVETLLGDASKAREKLGWSPRTSFEELVAEMLDSDLALARRDALVSDAGFRANGPDR